MHEETTKLIPIDPIHPQQAIIEEAAKLIQHGRLVVFPTETVYGLGAAALQVPAVASIFTAKGRPFSDPLIVHIADRDSLQSVVTEIPLGAYKLLDTFWPGPLTLILPAASPIPRLVTAGLPTVAVRMPLHPIALALIRAAGTPIAAPSANRFMHISPTTAQHVLADLDGRVPLILDGGPCTIGVESTVVDLCCERPRILRPGGVSLEALRMILPEIQAAQCYPPPHATNNHHHSHASPGQMLTHYAPTVPTLLFEGETQSMQKAMLAELQRRQARGERVGLLIADEDLPTFQNSAAQIFTLGDSLEHIAMQLFGGLRQLEEAAVDVILCRSFAVHGLGLAIRDRLHKAAGGTIVYTD